MNTDAATTTTSTSSLPHTRQYYTYKECDSFFNCCPSGEEEKVCDYACIYANVCVYTVCFNPCSYVPVCLWVGGGEGGVGVCTGQIPTHNLNLIGLGLTGSGQNEEKISRINQDKIIS